MTNYNKSRIFGNNSRLFALLLDESRLIIRCIDGRNAFSPDSGRESLIFPLAIHRRNVYNINGVVLSSSRARMTKLQALLLRMEKEGTFHHEKTCCQNAGTMRRCFFESDHDGLFRTAGRFVRRFVSARCYLYTDHHRTPEDKYAHPYTRIRGNAYP